MKTHRKKIKTQTELTKDEEKNIKKIIKLREKKHLNKILEYQGKTSRPLVIIVGCWHLRKSSLLRKKLKNYKIIIPSDEKGNPLFSPKEVKEVNITLNVKYSLGIKMTKDKVNKITYNQ